MACVSRLGQVRCPDLSSPVGSPRAEVAQVGTLARTSSFGPTRGVCGDASPCFSGRGLASRGVPGRPLRRTSSDPHGLSGKLGGSLHARLTPLAVSPLSKVTGSSAAGEAGEGETAYRTWIGGGTSSEGEEEGWGSWLDQYDTSSAGAVEVQPLDSEGAVAHESALAPQSKGWVTEGVTGNEVCCNEVAEVRLREAELLEAVPDVTIYEMSSLPMASISQSLTSRTVKAVVGTVARPLLRAGARAGPAGVAVAITIAVVGVATAAIASARSTGLLDAPTVMRVCTACKGQGTIACDLCKQKGEIKWEGKFRRVTICPSCMGGKQKKCPACGGFKKLPAVVPKKAPMR